MYNILNRKVLQSQSLKGLLIRGLQAFMRYTGDQQNQAQIHQIISNISRIIPSLFKRNLK